MTFEGELKRLYKIHAKHSPEDYVSWEDIISTLGFVTTDPYLAFFGILIDEIDAKLNPVEVDKYGNRDGELKYCCFPDCGCDGSRLCMAEEGPNVGSIQLNLEKQKGPTYIYEDD